MNACRMNAMDRRHMGRGGPRGAGGRGARVGAAPRIHQAACRGAGSACTQPPPPHVPSSLLIKAAAASGVCGRCACCRRPALAAALGFAGVAKHRAELAQARRDLGVAQQYAAQPGAQLRIAAGRDMLPVPVAPVLLLATRQHGRSGAVPRPRGDVAGLRRRAGRQEKCGTHP